MSKPLCMFIVSNIRDNISIDLEAGVRYIDAQEVMVVGEFSQKNRPGAAPVGDPT